jgi:hypothetical protein
VPGRQDCSQVEHQSRLRERPSHLSLRRAFFILNIIPQEMDGLRFPLSWGEGGGEGELFSN